MQQEMLNGFRLSKQQARLWQAQDEEHTFCAQAAIQIEGPLDVDALQRTIQHIADQNEILRTNFARLPGMTLPVQVVAESCSADLHKSSRVDLASLFDRTSGASGKLEVDTATSIRQCQLLFKDEKQSIVHGKHDQTCRFALLTLAPNNHLLTVTLPALCADGWSLWNLLGEIAHAYEGQISGTQPADDEDEILQYVQFAQWQHEMFPEKGDDGYDETDEDTVAGRAYWQEQALADQTILTLPYERQPIECVESNLRQFEPETLISTISTLTTTQLAQVAESLDATPSAFLLACWQTLLWRITHRTEFVIAETGDGRPHEMLYQLLGLFAGTVPIKTRLDPNLRVRDLVTRTRQTQAEAAEWQEYIPWQEIEHPMIGFEFVPSAAEFNVGTTNFAVRAQRVVTDRFGLKLLCQPTDDSLIVIAEYDPARFRSREVERLLRSFETLVQGAVTDVNTLLDDLEILSDIDRQQLLVEFNDTAMQSTEICCWHQQFAEQAALTPDAIALIWNEQQITYAELNARANQLAHYLQSLGAGASVGLDVPIGLCMTRSSEMIVGMLAILKAGGAYLPLDPTYPLERISFTLQNAQAPILLTQSALMQQQANMLDGLHVLAIDQIEDDLHQQPTTDPASKTSAENLAYVIYTSGSTGKPKGVMVRHGAVMNLAAALDKTIYQNDHIFHDVAVAQHRPLRVSVNAPLTFDSSVKQLVQLLRGHCLVLIPDEVRPDGKALYDFTCQTELDVLDCTPAQLRLLIDAGLGDASLANCAHSPDLVLVGGEAIDPALWDELANSRCTIFYNVYGPTETTVDATSCAIRMMPTEPTIGQPLGNIQLYILDKRLRPVPLGTPGELYIGGAGLARGYLNAPAQTAERFVPNPFSNEAGQRLYRTGDLAAYRGDGNIKFLGRADHQIKLRGFRIELGEIEAAVNQYPSIRECTVILRADSKENPRLVAYLVEAGQNASLNGASADNDAPLAELRSFLRTKLPEYMIPSIFVSLAALPLSRNGKVDRNALPEPESIRPAVTRNYVAPRNQVEQTVAHVWQEVLGVEKVGADDNFFDLGGHSLLMVKVHHSLRSAFEREISLMDMFRNPTVGTLAQYLSQDEPQDVTVESGTERGDARKAARDKRRNRRQKRSQVHA